jgi:PAS domain S-box-containing protein
MTPPTPASNPPAAVGGRLWEMTHDLLATAGADRRLTCTNPAWEPLLGWTTDELRDGSYLRLVHPDDVGRVIAFERDVLAGRAGERPETELRLRARDGGYRWLAFSASYSVADELVFLCGRVISRDITARRRAELALEQRAGELERSNAELEQFAYVASHDLSEPLRMVSSYLQLLRRRYQGKLDADADQFIDFAVDGAARMRDLIDDLLTYSRAGRGDQPLEPVDSRAVVERVVVAVQTVEDAREARIAVGNLPAVLGDRHQLVQLFQNLIGNAIKFVPEDRMPDVGVSAVRTGERWRFEVADNGIGLEPSHEERIFRMFQRLHTRDEYPGTGIGLAIAKKVVERHGGTIWAEPRPEGGSRFCFTLPAIPERP